MFKGDNELNLTLLHWGISLIDFKLPQLFRGISDYLEIYLNAIKYLP